MIVGFDDDLAAEATRLSNRLRGLFTQVHPHPERVLGPRMQHPAVLKLLSQYGSRAQIRKAGRRRLATLIYPKAPRMAERLVERSLRRTQRADRRRRGHRRGRTDRPQPRRLAPSSTGPAQNHRRPDRGTAGDPPLFPCPDVHARYRHQDRSPHSHRRRGRNQFPLRSPPRRLRRPCPDDAELGHLDPRRTAVQTRKQAARTSLLPLRVRRPGRPRLPHLLRQKRSRRANTTPKPSSASPAAEPTFSSPCSRRHLLPTTNPDHP